ncbi:Arm DNA-binding domain-containing protein [Rossellomorea marisflavi]|uniref:Arm DNA-binding domain-containing protein n=1 Tax=Rossellomorea marisflavi TaxID=189381 RepID=UPI00345DEDF9
MKGHFYKRGCKCKKKSCTCGAKWTYVVDIGIDLVSGKRKQKSKSGFKSKKEAEAAAVSLIHELEQGTYIEESDQRFSSFAEQWLPIYSEAKDVKLGTIRVRLHEMDKLMPYFGQLKLKDITGKRYQDALNDLKDRGYSDSTREGINRTGKMIFRKALEMELIKKDSTEFAYLKKIRKLDFCQ